MKNWLAKFLPAKAKARRKPKGRYARVWLSSEFIAWCQRHHLKVEVAGACVLHTAGLRNAAEVIVRSDHGPVDEALYDLPSDQPKEAP